MCITHLWEYFTLNSKRNKNDWKRQLFCCLLLSHSQLTTSTVFHIFITVVRNDRCWNKFSWHFKQTSSSKSLKVSIHPLLHLKNRFLLLVQFSHNTAPTYPSCYAFNRSFNDWKLLSFRIFCISIVFCSSASGKENICY